MLNPKGYPFRYIGGAYPFNQNAGSYPFNQNAGSYPFNQNAGAILTKRNYINRKLDEIEQKLIELGWMEPVEEEEEYEDEFVESAGALIPYRNKVNERLNFYEAVIKQHLEQPSQYSPPEQQEQSPQTEQTKQFEESFKNNFASIFG